ncbi:acyl-CoA thioesterase II [Kocuria dechangensis]|uniref:Acyl-CoA thioesterase II n=1 Tax=Kocuria dechangensis TaxID=1176249 RepID=A0A917LPB9_9MICC|nr:acyl-CoA thioesterase domain-containing protein [Kocuria dechangensis]GGG47300.1 acyl-CoA thioesterase II [Kocuria dechangensis]
MTTTVSPTSAAFLATVDLQPAEAQSYDEAWTAQTQWVPWPKAFGGDMVAQAAAAMMRSVGEDRVLHSMHSYFMRPVDIGAAVRYEVERVRDGRGYSTRHVRAFQNGKAVYDAIGSFHVPEDGTDDAPAMPQVPAPEDLASSAEVLVGVDGPAAEYWANGRSFDIRHVEGPVYLQVEGPRAAHQAVWVKAFDRLPDDPDLHRAALAYVCDYTILEPLLRSQGLAWAAPGLVTASLDHSMWFHREGRADEWVLYVQDACSLQNNRGLVRGQFFDRGGRLLASVAQEGMIRPGA